MPAGSYVAPPGVQQIAQGVRDVDNTAPAVASLGAAINVSAAAGDPWLKVLPGGYAPGSAGKVFGDNIDAKISTVRHTPGRIRRARRPSLHGCRDRSL